MWFRDFEGYAAHPPKFSWPEDSRVAVSIVVNLEEGAELQIADGDERNESAFETVEEVRGAPDPCTMSHFEYGTRRGYWRLMEVFESFGVQVTVSSCGRVAERAPHILRDAAERGHEISCHGYRWETHAGMEEEAEKNIISKTVDAIKTSSGVWPVGWHTRSAASKNTRRLLVENGGFLYDSDAYSDDLPFLSQIQSEQHVVLPYSFDTNDMRFTPGGGFVHAEDFGRYCTEAFDVLWREGATSPKMMSVGLHTRIIGRPARIRGLEMFLERAVRSGSVWFAKREQIAHHWRGVAGLEAWKPRCERA